MVNQIDYIIIILYFVVLLSAGYVASKKARSKEDYLVAGRSLPLPMFTACMAAVVIGGGCTLGGTALAYESGIAGIWVGGMYAISIFLLALLLRTKMSNMRIFSSSEGVGIFYGPQARTVSALVMLIYLFMIAVIQIVGIGTILHIMLGWNNSISMIAGGLIIVAYLIFGGMWAVAFTDIIQFTVMTLGVLILAPILALTAVGGFEGLATSLPESYFDITSIGSTRIFAYVLLLVPGFLVGQDIWQKAFTAKSPKIAKRGTLIAAGYIGLYAIATVIIGMSLYAVNPSLDNINLAFATAAVTFSPTGIRGLILAAALASIMSTANGGILGSATVIYNDMISVKYPNITDKKAIRINRLLAGGICVLVVICALWIQSVLVALDVAYAYLSGCIFVPLVFAFILKKVSARAGLYALTSSAIVVTLFFIIDGITSTTPIMYGMLTSAVVFFVTNAIDKKKREVDFIEGGVFIDGKEQIEILEKM
jgi:SSS family solute:Na+ symporter